MFYQYHHNKNLLVWLNVTLFVAKTNQFLFYNIQLVVDNLLCYQNMKSFLDSLFNKLRLMAFFHMSLSKQIRDVPNKELTIFNNKRD
jgi:hypothetical protein